MAPPGAGGPAETDDEGAGAGRRRIALIAGGGLGAVVLLFVVVFLVATLGRTSPPERAVESFHVAAREGDCDSMMQLIQLPPDDKLPRPKDALRKLLCNNAEKNIDRIPESIDTSVVSESDKAAKIEASGTVDDREWSETYKLTKHGDAWRIRWGRADS